MKQQDIFVYINKKDKSKPFEIGYSKNKNKVSVDLLQV